MINKITTFNLIKDYGLEILDDAMLKTASEHIPENYKFDDDYLHLVVRAVSAGEFWGDNKNNDYFPEQELLKGYKTFLSAHTFKNHENKLIEKAIGDVVTSTWSDDMKCVELFLRIDRRIAPSIVRGFEKGFMTDVSMGCRIDHSICSICGNKAKTKFEYCDHIKNMRGRILDNGKKVYEININPRFHDISAVLNGAERSAKAISIIMSNNKVAYADIEDNGLEKVASCNESLQEAFSLTDKENAMTKVAYDSIENQFEKDMSKKKGSDFKKISEAKKKVNDSVKNKAIMDKAKDGINLADKIGYITNLICTKFWDKNKCVEIGNILLDISKEQRKPRNLVFDQFLKVCDFSNVVLSPLEIHDIYHTMHEEPFIDMRNSMKNLHVKNINELEEVIKFQDGFNIRKSVPDMLKMIGTPSALKINNSDDINKVIKIKINPIDNNYDDGIISRIMKVIMRNELNNRSTHRAFAAERLLDLTPCDDFKAHMAPLKILKISTKSSSPNLGPLGGVIGSGIIKVAYESDRVNRANNGILDIGISKMASEFNLEFDSITSSTLFEKTAKIKPVKSALTAIPLTLAYSALQRSRMNNGEDISSLNRYFAENPSGASGLVSAGVYSSLSGAKTLAKKNKIKKDYAKRIKFDSKIASEDIDIFATSEIDQALYKEGMSKEDIVILKEATILNELNEEYSHNLLKKASTGNLSLGKYLQQADKYLKIELEKTAILKDLSKNLKDAALGAAAFGNSKNPLAASIPGIVVDGLVLTGVGKGFKKLQNKFTDGGMSKGE